MISDLRALAFIGLLGLSGLSSGATCDFIPARPKPAWVGFEKDFSRIDGDYFEGVGFWERGNANPNEQIKQSRQAALESLVTSIQVNVKTSLVQETSKRETSGVAVAESSLKSVTEATTQISLKNVQAADVWLDRDQCVVWTLLRVPKRVVEASQREQYAMALLGIFKEQVKLADDATQAAEKRIAAYRQATVVLGNIDFSLLTGVPPIKFFQEQLTRLKTSLGEVADAKTTMTDALRKVDQLLGQAKSEMDGARKSRLQHDAVLMLKGVVEKYPTGVDGVFRPSEIHLRLGVLEKERSNYCAARNYFQRTLADGTTEEKGKAQLSTADLKCDEDQQLTEAWRQTFEAKKIGLVCATQLGSAYTPWTKACDAFGTQIRNNGGSVLNQALRNSPPSLVDVGTRDNITRYVESAGQDGNLLILAQGKMNRRRNPENTMGGQDYQFSGQLAVFFVANGKTLFSDNLQATSGWNPVSEQMTMEVVALNLVKRWKEKFSEYVKQ
ncbi:MAG: hypothetical protein WC073_02230 [Sterolibacterium sp.]